MIAALRTNIYNLGKNALTNWYYIHAKQNDSYPYGVFLPIAAPVNNDTTPKQFTQIIFQTSLFSKRLNEIETIESALQAQLNVKSNYSVSGFNVVGQFLQINGLSTREDDVWAINSQYFIELEKQ